ncbi:MULTISPECIES: LacI family DNA-binding transcriptional regulator [unclassified Streptomyces]|uniref:LacI family DNA-binding transcriptional regulator n=1 Tax=unclassified Streptomyces TaxID=2593676 RepID=UPI002E314FD4|nr:LacI family DNA-binding transcriptional regulator [Streptomyces sp. NBC_01361]
MRRRVSIKDVAREAGVSLGTVSNVLNRPETVAPPTRARVQGVIDRLGYIRSEGARQLHGMASRMVAVLAPDASDPFFTALSTCVEQAAREADLGLLVGTGTRDPAEADRYLSLIASHRIRGAVLGPGHGAAHVIAVFNRQAIPYVVIDRDVPPATSCSVRIDDAAGGRAAARHLIEQGHRSIAYVSGPDALRQVREVRRGAVVAVARAGLTPSALQELPCPRLTLGAGRDAGQRILGQARRPTAVLCADDLLALGVMQSLYEAGLRVPDDIAVIGYGDTQIAASAVVPLTSVRRPAAATGVRAGRLLIEETGTRHEHQHVVIQPELFVRHSSRARATAH